MTNGRWGFLTGAIERLGASLWPNGLEAGLADQLETAVASADAVRLAETRDQLAQFARQAHALLPEEAAQQLRDAARLGPLALVYQIGQIDFADHFAGRLAQRRAPDAFLDALKSRRFQPMLHVLFLGECSNSDIADTLGIAKETVSRQVAELRELGVVDCRKEGRNVINFLTPAARTAFVPINEVKSEAASDRGAARRFVDETKDSMPVYLRGLVAFSVDEQIAAE